jgi:hypothetical protein
MIAMGGPVFGFETITRFVGGGEDEALATDFAQLDSQGILLGAQTHAGAKIRQISPIRFQFDCMDGFFWEMLSTLEKSTRL